MNMANGLPHSGMIFFRMIADGILLFKISTFNLDQIAKSGQCFRMIAVDDGYIAITGMNMVKITLYKDCGYLFHCSYDDFHNIWVPYFDLKTNYEELQERMTDDPFLLQAIAVGGGIRILRQDLWEMIVTFTISQRNNIPRIRKSINMLSELYGTLLGEIDGHKIYSFPTPAQLRGKDLSSASLGYREDYVRELIEYEDDFWQELKSQDDDTALRTLTGICGIGPKVANCVMLFGLHRMGCYPKDVWINRMIDDIYQGNFDHTQYADFAGYVQQLQFFYYRQIAKGGE